MAGSYNFLAKKRASDFIEVPASLTDLHSFEWVEDKSDFPVHPQISPLFPYFKEHRFFKGMGGGQKRSKGPLRVGVVLSGGPAPGGHNVIAGLFDALKAMHANSTLLGFIGGPLGIIEKKTIEITHSLIEPYRNSGGFDLIGSGRTKIESPEQFEAALDAVTSLNLDGLVIVGGDDSNTNAALLAHFFIEKRCKTVVVGVPKTIDGDLKGNGIEVSFGFDTACKTYCELIGNLARDVISTRKYTHFVRLMGRSASHIALECAFQTQPNLTFISEEIAEKKQTLKELVELLCQHIIGRFRKGKPYGIVLIPEGLIENIVDLKQLFDELNHCENEKNLSEGAKKTFQLLPESIQKQLLLDKDPHGNVQVSHIETEQLLLQLAQVRLKAENVTFQPVNHFFGYEGRCAFPSPFDATYCYNLGRVASLLIEEKKTGYLAAICHLARPVAEWQLKAIPLIALMAVEKRKGKELSVIRKALVDLKGKPFSEFCNLRKSWEMNDEYRFPGPIQFYGPKELTFSIPHTLAYETKAALAPVSP